VPADRHLGDDRDPAPHRDARALDRQLDLVRPEHGLDQDGVDTSLREGGGLLAEGLAHLGAPSWRARVEVEPTPPDRAPHPAAHPAPTTGAPAAEPRRRAVDLEDAPLAPARGEPEAVGAEGVRLDHPRAGVEVLRVDALDHLGPGDDQLLQAAVEREAELVEP